MPTLSPSLDPARRRLRSRLLSEVRRLLPGAAMLALSGCSYLPSFMQPDLNARQFLGVITPYRIEVVQGNVVTSEQAAAVKSGMNRAQVRDVLGSPLVADIFHADRWDYVFTIRRQGTEDQLRRVIVHFDGDKFKDIDTGGPLPSELEFVASIDTFKTKRNAPPLALTPEQIKALPAPKATKETAAIEPVGPTRSYPPLEPVS